MAENKLKWLITADYSDFEKGVNKVVGLAKSGGDAVTKGFQAGVTGTATLAAGITAVTVAGVAFLENAGEQAREIENLATLSGMGVEEFQNYAYATSKVGVEQTKLADISKDVHDKLGDFINTGAGPFKDFFNNVAPQIGLTAEELQGLAGPDVLVKVKEAMDAANLSAEEQTFYLESIANDSTKLAPLLENGGRLLQEQATHASALGLALSSVEVANLIEAQVAITDMGSILDSVKDKALADLAPVFTDLAGVIMSAMSESGVTVDDLADKVSTGLLTAFDWALSGVEFFHVGWLELKTAVPVVVDSFQTGVDIVYSILRTLLTPLDAIFEGMEKVANFVGKDFVNPFDTLQTAINDFGEVTQGVMEDNFQAISDTKDRYDDLHGVIQGHISSIGAAAETEKSAIASVEQTHTTSLETRAANEQAHADKQVELEKATTEELTDMWLTYIDEKDEADERALDAENDRIEEREELNRTLTDEIMAMTLEKEEYAIQSLEAEYEKALEVAGDDKELQTQLAEWKKLKLQEIKAANEDTTMTMASAWATFSANAKDSFTTVLGNGLRGEYSSLGDAWDGLWNDMESKLTSTASSMIVDWTSSAISSLFEGWDVFHAGIWDLKEDEVPAILQQGEMVIPKEHADEIRSYFPNISASGNFDALVASTVHADPGAWSPGGQFGANLGERYESTIKKALASVLGGGEIDDAISMVMDGNVAVKNVSQALTDTAITALGLDGAYAKTGAFIGKVASIFGLAGSSQITQLFGVNLGELIGAYLGDSIGDLLNDREWEGLRDAEEAGIISGTEAHTFRQAAISALGDDAEGSTLGGLFSSISGLWESAVDSITEAVESAWEAWEESQEDEDSGTSPLEDYYDGIEDSIEDDDNGADDDGENDWNGEDAGGYDDNGDYVGLARGGIVKHLKIPLGDQGWGALRLGEGVLDEDTMKILSTSIRNGEYGGNNKEVAEEVRALRQEVARIGFVVAKNTLDSAKVLKKFDQIGIKERA